MEAFKEGGKEDESTDDGVRERESERLEGPRVREKGEAAAKSGRRRRRRKCRGGGRMVVCVCECGNE